jgi:hypothetical protein
MLGHKAKLLCADPTDTQSAGGAAASVIEALNQGCAAGGKVARLRRGSQDGQDRKRRQDTSGDDCQAPSYGRARGSLRTSATAPSQVRGD